MTAKPSKFKEMLRNRKEGEDSGAEQPKRGRPGGRGKRGNPDYVQVTAYIRGKIHEETKINLIRQGNREFSELVEELLLMWNAKH
jgi:hypothetical protein